MQITHENFEEVINHITVELMLDNLKFRDRLNRSDWLSEDEAKETFLKVDFDTQIEIINFMKKNNMSEFEEGTTSRNMMEQFGEYLKCLGMLEKKG